MDAKKKKKILLGISLLGCIITLALAIIPEIIKATVYQGFAPVVFTLAFGAGQRLSLTLTAVCLLFALGLTQTIKPRIKGGVLITIAGFVIALANFPIANIAEGSLVISDDVGLWSIYLTYCLAVALFEETAFRGLVFPILLGYTKKKKHGVFLAVFLSSGIFALVHLLNLLTGASVPGTIMQVGYTFLIGGMCNVLLIATKSLLMPVLAHFAFDIGGLLSGSGIALGKQWNAVSVPIMAVAGVIVAVYMIVWFFKHEKDALLIYNFTKDTPREKEVENDSIKAVEN